MSDLREKIKAIIEKESKTGHFFVLDTDKSVSLIEQILSNYERTGQIKREAQETPGSDSQNVAYKQNNIDEQSTAKEMEEQADTQAKKEAELIFVAAPTGAGKDHLVVKLNYQNPEKRYVELNMDIFRQYFPFFIEDTSKITDKNFAFVTNEFSYEIYATIQEIILQEFPGTNIIITGTLRETDWVEDVFRRFKDDPKTAYKTKLLGLSVPKKESAISVIYRYLTIINSQKERLKKYPGTARYTTMKYHDETFERFPQNFEYFEEIFRKNPGELIDSVEVHTRSKDVNDLTENTKVYSSEDETDSRTALDVINSLRDKDYSVKYDYFSLISKRILANKDYLKSQETLKEVIRTLAEVLDYPKIVERLDKSEPDDIETDLGKN